MAVFDGNVFMQRAAMEQQKQQGMYDMLARGIQMYQQGKEREAAQLAQKKKAALDPQNIHAMSLMGQELTPEQRAVFQAQQEQLGAKRSVHPLTGQTYAPYQPIQLAGGQQPLAQAQPERAPIPFTDVAGGDVQTGGVYDTVQDLAGTPDTYITEEQLQMLAPEMSAPMPSAPVSGMGATPAGQMKSFEAGLEGQKEAAKLSAKEMFEERKLEREKERAMPKAQTAFSAFSGAAESIIEEIDKAIEQTGIASAGLMGGTSWVGGSPAANLEARLNTIQADAAFDTLQQMRDASKTGGALGAISERELALLRDARVALGQKQSPDQLKENLLKYKNIRQSALDNVAQAYFDDYGFYPEGYKKQASGDFDPLGLFK